MSCPCLSLLPLLTSITRQPPHSPSHISPSHPHPHPSAAAATLHFALLQRLQRRPAGKPGQHGCHGGGAGGAQRNPQRRHGEGGWVGGVGGVGCPTSQEVLALAMFECVGGYVLRRPSPVSASQHWSPCAEPCPTVRPCPALPCCRRWSLSGWGPSALPTARQPAAASQVSTLHCAPVQADMHAA